MAMVQQRVMEPEWRAAVRKLGTFTVSELAAELGCTKATAKRHLDEMATSDPPLVRPDGHYKRMPMFMYLKPTEAGERFEAQRRLRVVATPEQEAATMAASRNDEVKQSHIGSIPNKAVRSVCREAVRQGWQLMKVDQGDHPFRLCKPGRAPVTVPSSPRNAGDAVSRMRQNLFGELPARYRRTAG